MKIRIRKERVIAFLLVFVSLNLPVYDHIGGIVSALNDPMRVLVVFGAGLMVIKKKRARFTPLFWWLLLMEFELLVSTVINDGSMWVWFRNTCGVFAFVLIFEAWSDDPKELILALMPLMELLCYGNYLSILIFPQGLYIWENGFGWESESNWLLGYRTGFICYLLPACLIAFLFQKYGGKKWRAWGVYIVSFIMVALPPSRSATSAIGLTVFFFMLYLVHRGCKFNVYLLVGINIAAFFVVVVFRQQEVFLRFVSQFFEKNITTMSGRTLLWDNLFQLVKENPLFGCGVQADAESVALLKFNYGVNGHNNILQYLYQGGAIQLAMYFCMMVTVYRRLRRVQERVAAQMVSVALFALQIIGLTEHLQQGKLLYSLYYFAYFADQISATTTEASEISIRLKTPKKRLILRHTSPQRREK